MRYSKEKDFAVTRETEGAKTQHRKPSAVIKDYSLKHKVSLHWDINPDAKRDQMFVLKAGATKLVLDKEELIKAIRFV